MLVAVIFLAFVIVYLVISFIWYMLLETTAEPITFTEALGWLPILILRLIEEALDYLKI